MADPIPMTQKSPMMPGRVYTMTIEAIPMAGGTTLLDVTFPRAHGLGAKELRAAWFDLMTKLIEDGPP